MDRLDSKMTEKAERIDDKGKGISERVLALQQLLAENSNLELTDAMTTLCGINEAEFRIYLVVLDHPHCSIAEIADILDLDHSTIGKQVKSLLEREFVTRYPRNVADGGVKYLYVAQPLAETAEWLQHELDRWTNAVLTQLEQLQSN